MTKSLKGPIILMNFDLEGALYVAKMKNAFLLITLKSLFQISQMRYRWNTRMKTSSSQTPNLVYGLMMPS